MGRYIKELAEMFNERKNPNIVGVTIGEITSLSPIRISYGDSIILKPHQIVIADSLLNGYTAEYTDDNGTTTVTKKITIKNELNIGDKVIIIASNSNQKYFVIDKVG
jgi:hypothetical protein